MFYFNYNYIQSDSTKSNHITYTIIKVNTYHNYSNQKFQIFPRKCCKSKLNVSKNLNQILNKLQQLEDPNLCKKIMKIKKTICIA